MLNGIINVYKEKGWTSSDAVVKLRRILNTGRIGHTGTLDPMAEGVLPVCVGKATRLADYIMNGTKTYIAEITFGTATDTQDSTGQTIAQDDKIISAKQLESVLPQFTGTIEQLPPMYSAIKKEGKKLYEYARAGVDIKREPREITVFSIRIVNQPGENRFCIEVNCSKGTYIRTLCADIGKALDTCAHMSALERTACGAFTTNTAYKIEQITSMMAAGYISFLMEMDSALTEFGCVEISRNFENQYKNGLQTPPDMVKWCQLPKEDEPVRVYIDGKFYGLARLTDNRLKILCNLYTEDNISQ